MKIKDSTTREYLFRGKRKDTGEWVEGDLYHRKYSGGSGVYITYYDIGGNYYEVEVIPETVGMFTGLTDKNGKKIFKGDICKARHNILHVIKYGEYTPEEIYEMFLLEPITLYGLHTTSDNCDCVIPYENTMEVVGNIYDNPELLEGGGENAK